MNLGKIAYWDFLFNVSTLEEDSVNPFSFSSFSSPLLPPLSQSFIPVLSALLLVPRSCLSFARNGTSLLRAYRMSKLRFPLQSYSFKQPVHTKRQLAPLMKTSLKLEELQAWGCIYKERGKCISKLPVLVREAVNIYLKKGTEINIFNYVGAQCLLN